VLFIFSKLSLAILHLWRLQLCDLAFHEICNRSDLESAKREFMIIMANLFGRRYMSRIFAKGVNTSYNAPVFVANSGHDDVFSSVSELTCTSWAALNLNEYAIPAHGQVETLAIAKHSAGRRLVLISSRISP
jgi:hypothetical protein